MTQLVNGIECKQLPANAVMHKSDLICGLNSDPFNQPSFWRPVTDVEVDANFTNEDGTTNFELMHMAGVKGVTK